MGDPGLQPSNRNVNRTTTSRLSSRPSIHRIKGHPPHLPQTKPSKNPSIHVNNITQVKNSQIIFSTKTNLKWLNQAMYSTNSFSKTKIKTNLELLEVEESD
jgi:hypothetical protein